MVQRIMVSWAPGRALLSFGLLFVVVARLAGAEQEEPAPAAAQAQQSQQPIAEESIERSEDAVDLKPIDKQLFKRLFIKRRKEHLEAVKHLQKINSYERQYKMINVLAEKMFDVIESKKVLLENFTDSKLSSISLSSGSNTKDDVRDALSSVLENIALFGDIVLNLPDITQRILKTQPKWNATILWSFDFLNRTKDWLDKSTLEMINLVLQELNITKREPDYFNPNRLASSRASGQNENTKKSATKKEKRKKGPTMTKIEL